jgi:hypothetical protein
MQSKVGSKQARANSDCVAGALPGDTNRGVLREKERLRRRYRPDHVQILFVGEAPPASGRFFYQEDSGLYRAARDTFMAAFPSLRRSEFLDAFRDLGCYLVDLCGQAVDHMPRSTRASICCAGEARLARTIRTLRPIVIVTLVRSIRANVKRAQMMAGWLGLHLEPPYPGRWKHHRVEFQRQLVPVLLKTLSHPSRVSKQPGGLI